MLLRSAAFSLLLSTAAALIGSPPEGVTPRKLEDDDFSWMSGYTVLYENCFHSESLALFRLCPADSTCQAGCEGGGSYLLDLAYFLDQFTEAQLGAREYRCEMARENCDYDDEEMCYQAQGLDYCNDNQDEFNLQEYLECNQYEDTEYYVAPYCAEDNVDVYLGVYSDQYCTEQVDASVLYDTYGYTLPYTSESIIANECANCKEHGKEEDQDEGDQEDEDDVLEQCELLWTDSMKCEDDMDVEYADLSACGTIETIAAEENVMSEGSPSSSSRSGLSKSAWGWIVGIIAAVLIFACCCGFFMMKKKKEADLQPNKENLI